MRPLVSLWRAWGALHFPFGAGWWIGVGIYTNRVGRNAYMSAYNLNIYARVLKDSHACERRYAYTDTNATTLTHPHRHTNKYLQTNTYTKHTQSRYKQTHTCNQKITNKHVSTHTRRNQQTYTSAHPWAFPLVHIILFHDFKQSCIFSVNLTLNEFIKAGQRY